MLLCVLTVSDRCSQGLMAGLWCLDPHEGLSPGQMQEIDRVYNEHADLSDDDFVATHLQKWLA